MSNTIHGSLYNCVPAVPLMVIAEVLIEDGIIGSAIVDLLVVELNTPLNPTSLVILLSPSTEAYDAVTKLSFTPCPDTTKIFAPLERAVNAETI